MLKLILSPDIILVTYIKRFPQKQHQRRSVLAKESGHCLALSVLLSFTFASPPPVLVKIACYIVLNVQIHSTGSSVCLVGKGEMSVEVHALLWSWRMNFIVYRGLLFTRKVSFRVINWLRPRQEAIKWFGNIVIIININVSRPFEYQLFWYWCSCMYRVVTSSRTSNQRPAINRKWVLRIADVVQTISKFISVHGTTKLLNVIVTRAAADGGEWRSFIIVLTVRTTTTIFWV